MKENETFETALKKLEIIVRELESGSVNLEDSMEKYTKAMELVNFCSDKLKTVTETVNKIMNTEGKLEEFKEIND